MKYLITLILFGIMVSGKAQVKDSTYRVEYAGPVGDPTKGVGIDIPGVMSCHLSTIALTKKQDRKYRRRQRHRFLFF